MNTWMAEPFKYPREADRPRQGAGRSQGPRARRVLGPVQGRGRRRHSVADRCRAPARRRSSRAARATTRWPSTPSGRTTTSRTSTGSRASSRRRRRSCRRRSWSPTPAPTVGIIALRLEPLGAWKNRATSCAKSSALEDVLSPAARLSVHARSRGVHPACTSASTSSSRIATAQMLSLLRMDGDPTLAARLRSVAPLQRPADRRAQHHRRSPKQRNNEHRRHPTPSAKRRPTASASTSRPIEAARRRSAPDAATTPSPSASSTPSSRWASTRSA